MTSVPADFQAYQSYAKTIKGKRLSGILILPVSCLFLSIQRFLCTSAITWS